MPLRYAPRSGAGDVAFVQQWHVDDPEHGLASLEQGERDRAQGASLDEVGGAVDRVEHPHPRWLHAAAGLLAEERDVGGVRQRGLDMCLDLEINARGVVAVALGDQAADMGAPVHHQPSAEVDGAACSEQQLVELALVVHPIFRHAGVSLVTLAGPEARGELRTGLALTHGCA
jgi:hypothetical protein